MGKLRTLQDVDSLQGKTVIVRADLDVPVQNGQVQNDFRLKKAVNTLKYLVQKKAKVVVVAHLGRPEGEYKDEMSLMPVRFELGKLLDTHIKFAHLPNSRNSIRYMEEGEILLLENIRFSKEEESKDAKARAELVKTLAELADYYVNDAFATYRPAASNFDLAQQVKNPLAGLQMQAEIENLSRIRDNFESPYVAVIGGAKIDTKVDVLLDLVEKADHILIGGAMAYTFLKAQGIKVGKSKVEDANIKIAEKVLKAAKKSGCNILLPVDHICAEEFSEKAKAIKVETQQIPAGLIGMDIGERTLAEYLEIIKSAKTILWNGPMGVFEWEKFSRGTEAIGEYIGLSASKETFKVAGGGDTISAMEKLKVNFRNYNHISTGGGAMLAFLTGEEFPTIELLQTKSKK
jgi:3-phosphoglycerate kinase